MMSDTSRVIVRGEDDPRQGSLRMNIHHQDFPELWAEGTTADEGARHLAERLGEACDWTCENWRREALRRALADVDEYLQGAVATGGVGV